MENDALKSLCTIKWILQAPNTSYQFIHEHFCSSSPLIYGFVHILVLWAQLFGSLCSQLLTVSPKARAHQTSLPQAWLCHMQTELPDLEIMPKSLLRAAPAELICECWCVGGGPTASPGSLSCNTAAALQLSTAHRALQPPLELQSLHPKFVAMLPFTAVSQWSNPATGREK